MRALLKEKLFRKHYDKLLQSRREQSRSSSVNTFSSVTILAPASNHDTNELKEASRYFRNMGMSCDVYVVRGKSDSVDITANVHLIDMAECMWYGVPSQEILIKWLANKTDLLILSNPKRETLMKYLCAASNSKLKTTLTYSKQQNDDIDIDLWIDVKEAEKLNLVDQCKLTYRTLTQLGIRPPVIG